MSSVLTTLSSRSSRLRQGLAVLALSVASLGCSFFPPEYSVPLSFSVRVTNAHGPVVGLTLKVTNFKSDEFSRLSSAQQRTTKPEQFVELIAEAFTDDRGEAHFNLSRSGHFTLQPDHPANQLDWVGLNVVADAKSNTVRLEWPTSTILEAKQLRGRISTGLMSSRSLPIQKAVLSIRALVSFKEIATAVTNDDTSFRFDDLPPGAYFLHVGTEETVHGDIPVYIGAEASRDSLSIAAEYTSCGLSYDLEENKPKYRPEVCFKGGVPVTCDY
jgi:hypothetical protein